MGVPGDLHANPQTAEIPSAVSITLRICREIDRWYDGAVKRRVPGPGGAGSGGPKNAGANRPVGSDVAQLFQREPVS